MVSVYLTFLYRYLIYTTLFISRFTPASYRGRRVIALTCTIAERLCVVGYTHWSLINLVRVPYHFRYAEVWLPLLILIVIFLLGSFLVNLNMSYTTAN